MGRWISFARRVIVRVRPEVWALRAGPLRAALEALAITGVMLIVVLAPTDGLTPGDQQNGLFIMMLTGMCWYAIRLRRAPGRWWQQIILELSMGLGAGLLLGGLLLALGNQLIASVLAYIDEAGLTALVRLALGMVQTPLSEAGLTASALKHNTASAMLIAGAIALVVARNGMRLWLFWSRLRRQHMIWELAHSHLMLVVLGTVIVAALLIILTLPQMALSVSSASGMFISVAIALIPIVIVYGVLILVLLAIVLPPSILLAYFAARRTTRRLSVLMDGAAALSAGDTRMRIPVQGEDEVAALQTNFNKMAEELDRSLHALEAERDAVTTLLRNRRELVASVSHELRTPIATLRGHLEPLLARPADDLPANLRRDLSVMEREAVRLQRLIDDLFALSRAELGKLEMRIEPTDTSALIDRVVEAAAPLMWNTYKVELIADVPPDLPHANVDAVRLEQIIHNLLRNGVRHTAPGGIVAVTATPTPGHVAIQVKDTGEGIPADDLDRIWERFYRGSTARAHDSGGAGLGLALVKELAEAMGGAVCAESVAGQGSTFTINLPRVVDGAASCQETA